MCSYDSQYTAASSHDELINSISQKWSWKQKRWSQDHECTNLINILLFLPLILRLVKNLLLLLWLLEAKCELSSTSLLFLPPPAFSCPKNEEPLWSIGFNRLRGQPPLDHCTRKAPENNAEWDSCDNSLVLLGVFLSTINLLSPFPQKPFPLPLPLYKPLPSFPLFHLAELQRFLRGSPGMCFSPV